jgi:hypothetical protein
MLAARRAALLTPARSALAAFRAAGAPALWDADVAASIALAGDTVASWTDIIGGIVVPQATEALRPTYAPAGLSRRPCLAFSGAQRLLSTTAWTLGHGPMEFWFLVGADGAIGATEVFFDAGSGAAVSSRRASAAASGRPTISVGTGAAQISAATASILFGAANVVRAVLAADSIRIDVDGVVGAPVAVTPGTSGTRLAFGAVNGATLAAGFSGRISFAAVTPLLSDAQAAPLYAALNRRRG